MGAMDHTLKQTVPYYSTMKRAGACRGVQKAPEATEAAEENDADRIQPERAESHIKTARHSQSSRKEAVRLRTNRIVTT